MKKTMSVLLLSCMGLVGTYASAGSGREDTVDRLQKSVDVQVVVSSDNRASTETVDSGVKVARVGAVCNLASASICPGLIRRIREAKADLVHLHLPKAKSVPNRLSLDPMTLSRKMPQFLPRLSRG